MYEGPMGLDNGVGIDCGSGDLGTGQGRAMAKKVGKL